MRDNILIGRNHSGAWTVGAAMVALVLAVAIPSGARADRGHHGSRHAVQFEAEGAFLGITMQELTDELREGLNSKVKGGVLVSSVIEGSAAEKAGIEEGDIITEFDGKKIESPESLRQMIAKKDVGDEVKVKLFREGKSKSVDVALGDLADAPMAFLRGRDHFRMPPPDEMRAMIANLRPRRLGVQVHELDDKDLSSYFGVEPGEGVLVLGVEDETTAANAGIKSGDVIVGIDDKKVGSIEDIRDAMSDFEKGDKVAITVVRKDKRVKLDGEVADAKNVFMERMPDWHPRQMMRGFDTDQLRKELDELRKEVDQLKQQIDKS
jgi:S1-C subfamily serine protease